jgi:CDP-glucose 4,6-dehydratase
MESMVTNPMTYAHLESYYKGKRVFLTGHTGFKGSWMLYWLDLLGAEVKGYALAPGNKDDHFNVIEGSRMCESVIADIQDKARVEKEILDFQPDFIFHLAAQPLVRLSYQIPSETFAINAVGTAYLLDAVRKLSKPCTVVLITTDKVYENKEWHYPYRECDRLGGYDPYSASKACAELIVSSYRNSFFNNEGYAAHKKSIASARAGNVIGGGDWAKDRIIPDIVRAFNKDEAVVVRNPHAVRPWQHVLEPIGGYLHLGTKMMDDPIKYADAWNFGPFAEDSSTVGELVEIAISAWGRGDYYLPPLTNQPHEAGLLKLDISKTTNELGWQPQYNSRKAIEMTLEWYKAFCDKGYLQTGEQIGQFIKCNS